MTAPRKMNLAQLTFLVAINMMGSGIIMLPANMARVGAISLLSWGLSALGSMAIAYGFAQAGLFNQRAGGISAYAEDAYGRPGYFMVFYLYFFSLAVANVAIAISAVGYLAVLVPWLSSTPTATSAGALGLVWLTTLANFGGPRLTGKIGSVTVWGVILPVGALSTLGWLWFDGPTFTAAWNPTGLSLGQGLGSSIAVTMWALLGMEVAAQSSAAVENPKRDVPLACLLGTLIVAVIYVLSTAVIQGLVPNAELAASTGPFALAYARLFGPQIGTGVMVLAVVACLGSLMGWQFTIAQTGMAAAEDRMLPAVFSRVNRLGAPVVGMLIMGGVQSAMVVSTISPTLAEQFTALVNLAVVTNLVPYLIALSAVKMVLLRHGAEAAVTRRAGAVAMLAMLYSVYAIIACGKDAVFGAMVVMGFGYVLYGYLAPRLASAPRASGVLATEQVHAK